MISIYQILVHLLVLTLVCSQSTSPDRSMVSKYQLLQRTAFQNQALDYTHYEKYYPHESPLLTSSFMVDAYDLAKQHGVHPVDEGYVYSVVPRDTGAGQSLGLGEGQIATILWKHQDGERFQVVRMDRILDQGFDWKKHLVKFEEVLQNGRGTLK